MIKYNEETKTVEFIDDEPIVFQYGMEGYLKKNVGDPIWMTFWSSDKLN